MFQFFIASLVIYLLIAAVMLLVQIRAESTLFAHLRREPT